MMRAVRVLPGLKLISFGVVLLIPRLDANPLIINPWFMVAENVLVGVTDKGAVVSGRYRFHIRPDAVEDWAGKPPMILDLPVPVPVEMKPDDIPDAIHAVVTLNGVRYSPEKRCGFSSAASVPPSCKIAVLSFWMGWAKATDEYDIEIQYDQPIIQTNGRDMVYYLPVLPWFATYQKQFRLREESFTISFQGVASTFVRLLSDTAKVEKSEPQFIAVHPKHLELIAVERISRSGS